jgi:hypothetical protein
MKKEVQLSAVIKIKDFIEKLILNSQENIAKYNNTEMRIDKLLENLEIAEKELVPIKEVIQEANKEKHADGKTNNYYIYHLSNLKTRKIFLSNLKTTDKSQLNKEKIDEYIAEIDKEINEIKPLLAEFNKREVSIELTDNLVQLGLNI